MCSAPALRRSNPERLPSFDGIAFAAKHQRQPLTSNDTRAAISGSATAPPAQRSPRRGRRTRAAAAPRIRHWRRSGPPFPNRKNSLTDPPTLRIVACNRSQQPISAIDLSDVITATDLISSQSTLPGKAAALVSLEFAVSITLERGTGGQDRPTSSLRLSRIFQYPSQPT